MLSHGININSVALSLLMSPPLLSLLTFRFCIFSFSPLSLRLSASALSPSFLSCWVVLSALCLLLDCLSVCLRLCARVLTRETERERVQVSMYSLMHLSVCVCMRLCACWQSEAGGGTDRQREREKRGGGKKRDRGEIRWGEREAEHIAPPHSSTFLWKSSQTTAIGERHSREEQTSTSRSTGRKEWEEKEGRSQEHVLFGSMSTWHQLKYQASWQEEQRDWAVFISSVLDRKAQPWRVSRLALQRSERLILLSTSGPRDDCWSDRHVTDRNNHFLATPGVDWTFPGRNKREYSVLIGCEATTCFSIADADWMFVPCVFPQQLPLCSARASWNCPFCACLKC